MPSGSPLLFVRDAETMERKVPKDYKELLLILDTEFINRVTVTRGIGGFLHLESKDANVLGECIGRAFDLTNQVEGLSVTETTIADNNQDPKHNRTLFFSQKED